MKKAISLIILFVFISPYIICYGISHQVASPDQKFLVIAGTDDHGLFRYQVFYDGKNIITPSTLGLLLQDGTVVGRHATILARQDTLADTTWIPVYGTYSRYRDHYRQMTLTLQDRTGFMLEVIFRAYNEGVAFRYHITGNPFGKTLVIRKELTSFSIPGKATAWVTGSAQGVYREVPVGRIKKPAERPLLIHEDNGLYVAIGEAALVDYARMRLLSDTTRENTLISSLAGNVTLPVPGGTPWRFIMAGYHAGGLVENNYLLLNLNEPCALKDVSWIKPGKAIREVTLTTRGGKACIDFAAKHNLQFVEYDAGWYGPEYSDTSDATTVTPDPKRSKGPLDLQEVIRYGKEKGIGIILYVNRRALERQLDTILPLYESWGVKGVKYGFVRVGPQYWTSWLHEAIRKAAGHHLMVDVHDEYRPTGYSRTYPNFMTCEGIRGDEESPSNTHTLITLFTRTIAGPADNTNCYFSKRVDEKMGSHASQLAKTVCIYSPWQFLYWYDRPEGSPATDTARSYGDRVIGDEPELSFFDRVPTVWDDTRFLEGEPGKYATVARRHGDTWFIGSVNGEKTHTVTIPMTFLEKNKKYTATIYSDDPSVPTRTHVKTETRSFTRHDTFTATLKPNNGLAMIIKPVPPLPKKERLFRK